MVSDGDGIEKGSYSASFKACHIQPANDHATSSACLNDHAIIVNFRSMCRLKRMIEQVSNF